MSKSATDGGCEGCQFFLALIKHHFAERHPNTPQLFQDFVEQAKPIQIDMSPVTEQKCLEFDECRESDNNQDRVEIELCEVIENKFDPGIRYRVWPLPLDADTSEVFKLARLWLACCSKHKYCEAQEKTPLPTRLIEVPSDPKLPLRIVVTQKDWRDKYVALSHCWGGKVPSKTNSENIERRQTQGFESESLPKSFQDAVILTRELGFRYLWIDALCIIQGNEEDWAQESALMTHVYHNAILMISASTSPNSSSGIFKRMRMNHFQSSRVGRKNNFLWQSPSTIQSLEALVKNEPLGRRAWTCQEKVMAKRILYFQKQQMVWGCSECIYTESWGATPWRDPRGTQSIAWKSEVLLAAGDIHTLMRRESPDITPDDPEWNHLQPRLACWYQCVQEYAHRDLTFESDKLPALSGLAHGLCIPELKEYLAGLWEADLFRGLSWRYVDRNEVAVEEYTCFVAPSWSCMSARGKVMFYEDLSYYYPSSETRWEQERKPRLISHHVELGTSDPLGRITNGYILIQAYSRKILVHRHLRWNRSPWLYADTLSYEKREGGFQWRFDTTDGYLSPFVAAGMVTDERWPDGGGVVVEEHVAVQIHNYPDGNDKFKVVLLILDQVDQDGGKVYQRVGILSAYLNDEQKYNDRWQRQDFKII